MPKVNLWYTQGKKSQEYSKIFFVTLKNFSLLLNSFSADTKTEDHGGLLFLYWFLLFLFQIF